MGVLFIVSPMKIVSLFGCGVVAATSSVWATPPMVTGSQDVGSTNSTATSSDFFNGIARRSYLLGDMWGARPALSRYGVSVNVMETSEVLGNLTGGVGKGAEYDGLTQMNLQVDTQRAFGWYGGTFNVSALQIHGRNLSEDHLYNLQTASGIESDRALRLWELWYDQAFDRSGVYDLRLGQQSLDQEFMASKNALLFVNTMFGWPMVPSADMPGGGPAYPLSALGARQRIKLSDAWTFQTGLFNGSPAAHPDDAQQDNPSGTAFRLNDGVLAIAELQFTYPAPGSMVYVNKKAPMARVYKLGVWYDSENFADQRFDDAGLSLANPASGGMPDYHRGNYALYAVADQQIWQDANEANRSLNVFVRPMGTPLGDRNLVDFSVNAGLTLSEPFLGRDDDTVGLGMGYAHVSGRASDLDRDSGILGGFRGPVRSGEYFVELTYQYQLTPWCQVQPDFQYVFNPGGGVANPESSSGRRVQDEAIIGLRVNITF